MRAHSFAAARPAVADLSAEDLAERPRAAAAATRTDLQRGLHHRVRCDAGAVRPVAVAEPVLSAGVRHSVSVRREAGARAGHVRTVSEWVYISMCSLCYVLGLLYQLCED